MMTIRGYPEKLHKSTTLIPTSKNQSLIKHEPLPSMSHKLADSDLHAMPMSQDSTQKKRSMTMDAQNTIRALTLVYPRKESEDRQSRHL